MPAPRKEKPSKKTIQKVLKETGWNKFRSAEIFGVHRQTFDRWLKDYDLKQPLLAHKTISKEQLESALVDARWNRKKAAVLLGISRSSVASLMDKHNLEQPEAPPEEQEEQEEQEPIVEGTIAIEIKEETRNVPKKGVKRYLLTCAQNNTRVHQRVWDNLLRLAEHYHAEILVSRFTYNKAKYGPKSIKPGSEPSPLDADDLWYDPQLEPYLADYRIRLAPGLVYCGEMNTLPTAVRPLSGFESYTGRDSGIFPHPKLAMVSIPSGKVGTAKFNWTTGTITQRNYIQKKAGLKAQFHHVYGALLVEIDSDGDWFVRQINASENGEMYDMDVRVSPGGKITTGNHVEAITWGDIHLAFIDPVIEDLAWGEDGMLDTLRPKYQFFHDVLDFRARIHHDMRNPHEMFWKYAHGYEDAKKEVDAVADFLNRTRRSWCQSVVCDSNHDNMLSRWLREADYREDPKNAVFFLECQLRQYQALMVEENSDFHLLEDICIENGVSDDVTFLRTDESFIICPRYGGGIECGTHGHLGPDGTRGTPPAFARLGRKANTGHTHKAGIHDGIFTSGLCGKLQMRYNSGPSSWSHSMTVTYPNGKRAIYTFWNNKWRAAG